MRVEDDDSAVDRFGRQVILERLVDSNTVHISVVDEPDDLVGEQLGVVLAVEVGLCGLRRDILPHDLGHGLLDQKPCQGTSYRMQTTGYKLDPCRS